MNMRKITSMTLLVSMIILIINSVVLYIVPEGRVAYWSNWRLLGLTKAEWGEQHLTVGVLFVIALLLHTYFNWSLLVSYMKNRAKEIKIFTPSFVVGLVVTLVVTIGTYFHLPPMSTVVKFSHTIKNGTAKSLGVPPYGRAELSSLKNFAQRENLDLEKSLALLQKEGVQTEGADQSLKDIAKKNGISPQKVYDIIKPATLFPATISGSSDRSPLPANPPSGFGRKTLAEVSAEFSLDHTTLVTGFKALGIPAAPEMTMKEISAKVGKNPGEIYQVILTINKNQ